MYASSSDSEDVEVETFYEEIQKAKGYLKSQDIIIVMGDFKAKVGDERIEDVVGPRGIGTVNENGSRPIEWCQINEFTSQILGIKITLGDSRLGRALGIEVENIFQPHSETIPKRRQNINITVGTRQCFRSYSSNV
ncbi:craniofacial development protein 2-like [Plakobranchus ocellatus]|uniref:Craniofacial development protein 2-like n=1 Tax=Plakobranchus ocellatus TaxID=259542 RepID=A0AAV3ZYT5_9GAST|nr:craniofacial development protein 2-like [Plakobranchus ocellatus]